MPFYREAIGLDIGSHSVKAVHASRRRGKVVITSTDWLRLPSQPEYAERVLCRFLEKKQWMSVPCVVGLQGDAVLLRMLDLPPEDTRRIAQVLREEIQHFEGVGGQETIRDYATLKTLHGHRRLLMAVTRADAAQKASETPLALGVRLVRMLPSSVALYHGVVHACAPGPEAFACIDIGYQQTSLIVIQDGELVLARRFKLGTSAFPEHMRQLAPKSGIIELSPPSGRDATRELETRLSTAGSATELKLSSGYQQWLEELQSYLMVYQSQFPGETTPLHRMIVCGGGSFIEGLPEVLSASLDMPVERMEGLQPKRREPGEGRFAVAAGLALTGIGQGQAPMNLFPAARRERLELQWLNRYVAMGAGLVLVTLLLLIGLTEHSLHQLKGGLKARRTQLSELQSREITLSRFRERNDLLQREMQPLRRAVQGSRVARHIIYALGEAKHKDDWITLIADSHSYLTLQGQEPMGPPAPSPTGEPADPLARPLDQIVVEGYTPLEDLSTVRAMIEALREHPSVADADLLADDVVRQDEARDTRWAETGARLFAVEITVPSP